VELPNPPRRPIQLVGYAITLDQAVDWFFKQNPEVRSAREKLERASASNTLATEVPDAALIKAELELADVMRRGLLELKTSFYQAVLARLLIYEAQENLTYLDNYINRMQARYEEAVAPESEVTKWRLERARVTDAIAEAKLAERLARIKFFLLLGKTNSTIYGELLIYFDEAPAAPMKFTVEELVEIGLRERPDLRAAESLARLASKASGASKKHCASPKLRLACIFNNFIKLLAARSGDVVRRLPRSRLPLPNPAAASLSAPAHPYTKINVFWNGDSKRCNFS
jgi:outer membrane protein TolC